MIVELDGRRGGNAGHLLDQVLAIAAGCSASMTRAIAADDAERAVLWAGRKAAFPGGRAASRPITACMDGTIPPRAPPCPGVLRRMRELSGKLRPGRRQRLPRRRWQPAPPDPLRRQPAGPARPGRGVRDMPISCASCVAVGGVLTGEHGVGVEKARPDAGDVQSGRPGPPGAPEVRVRSWAAAQSRQGLPPPCTAVRQSSAACTCIGAPVPASGPAAVLSMGDGTQRLEARDGARGRGRDTPGPTPRARRSALAGAGTKSWNRLPVRGRPRCSRSPSFPASSTTRAHRGQADAWPARRWRRSRPSWRNTASGWRSSRWTMAHSSAASLAASAAASADHRGQRVRPAPDQGRRGASKDHFLGFSGVSGRGETFKAGGKVVKNVTGYDLLQADRMARGACWRRCAR